MNIMQHTLILMSFGANFLTSVRSLSPNPEKQLHHQNIYSLLSKSMSATFFVGIIIKTSINPFMTVVETNENFIGQTIISPPLEAIYASCKSHGLSIKSTYVPNSISIHLFIFADVQKQSSYPNSYALPRFGLSSSLAL